MGGELSGVVVEDDFMHIGSTSAPPSCVITVALTSELYTDRTQFLRNGLVSLDFESRSSRIGGLALWRRVKRLAFSGAWALRAKN